MSTTQFQTFATLITQRFEWLTEWPTLYRTDVSGDELWEHYIASFPEGSNPIFRVRTEHDGSIDRTVIKRVGNVVKITGDTVATLWDLPEDAPYPYNVVAQRMAELVKSRAITAPFLHNESRVGIVSNVERLENGDTITWHHLNVRVADRYVSQQVDKLVGEARTRVSVVERGLKTLTMEALDQVLELIEARTLYRGDEFLSTVTEFRALKVTYDGSRNKNLMVWENAHRRSAGIRNTAIGTLLVNLSEGMELEAAVRAFEATVAPANYRRTSAVITPSMVKNAMETIQKLNLETALQRRMATVSDVTVNNVLWADGRVKGQMKGGLESLLMSEVKHPTPNLSQAQEVTIDAFMSEILPKATGMEVLMEGQLRGNLMTLTAPAAETTEQLFRWNNGFAWSYAGNMTDTIKERVKAAGGNVDALLRVSLSWSNFDDLDLHCYMNRHKHIFFNNPAGILDVDMNAGAGRTRTPVENMAFSSKHFNGQTQLLFGVNNYAKRESIDVGFEIEVEYNGGIDTFHYAPAVRDREDVHLFTIQMDYQTLRGFSDINPQLSRTRKSVETWGVKTETFVPVQMVMLSPNHWDGQSVGNKHTFFILEGCKTNEPARGIYNEFLTDRLTEHRKVLEILGDKTKCPVADTQLSGLGFSSTIRKTLKARVTTQDATRLYTIQF